eukprot:TRINITY_DN8191_c0_g1_i2.p1 TRINITY_DN8191_c0_g1~~TRINITY_DN8191_c0_g1_i2.p1  ORF type:complete len:118 (+),score=25.57 TRINITY_DN8191_c0_g1_i2:307-660(+)
MDVALREAYLTDDEFKKVIGMSKAQFSELKKWRQEAIKKKVKLFQRRKNTRKKFKSRIDSTHSNTYIFIGLSLLSILRLSFIPYPSFKGMSCSSQFSLMLEQLAFANSRLPLSLIHI